MSERCEPPAELRGKDGWHWIKADENPAECWRWSENGQYWCNRLSMSVRQATSYGYRYVAPALTPTEADALRAENARLRAELKLAKAALEAWTSHGCFDDYLEVSQMMLATIAAINPEPPCSK